ncbi:tripartite tricarboxylate transporter TctB family protein [Ancylobacter mangrovi]|uniref:tripartite tricarboxylate transporter TctB family protein n=1 Tax=Ancylobacter mangrovi TaxID=2972472 RepID=UPI0021637FF9|nr:tripartite tricarboxylate transporter TctB family protein [Ancylobacter mangrovi]MCS0503716.1 tripartite tricarboxylate transporter TctB family protein [Ancylobacter mangrovi]
MKTVNHRDVGAGLLYVVLGLAFTIGASGYRMGTAARMGPGYFPFWLGVILTVIGAVVIFNAVRSRVAAEPMERWSMRGLFTVLACVVAFGFLLPHAGLIVSVLFLVIGVSFAGPDFSWRVALATAAVLLALTLALFVWLLDLQFTIWPPFATF